MLFGDVLLFAQRRNFGGGGQGSLVASCCVDLAILAVSIGWAVWYFMTTYKVLDACSPRNRDMEPGMVFLTLIPFFGIVWMFFVVFRISSSLEREFRSRGLRREGDFGSTLGMWGLIANLLCCAPVGLILQIIWLVQLMGFTRTLQGSGKRRRIRDYDNDEDEEDDDDDVDDRISRRRRRRDDDDD